MQDSSKGPVEREIADRLERALAPSQLRVINDSAHHRGHAGDDGSGESHFTVDIVAPAFSGLNRVARQRMVNKALGDLLAGTVHALAIKARAPEEV